MVATLEVLPLASKEELCSRALKKLDANVIQSFNEATFEAEVASTLYEGIKQSELSNYQWNFNIHFFKLSREVATPTDPNWKYQYLPPPNMLALITVTDKRGKSLAPNF